MPPVLSPFLCVWTCGCLTLEKNTATDGDVQVSFGTLLPILMAVTSGVRWLHHMVSLFLPLEETLHLVPWPMGHFTFSLTSGQGSNASRSSPTRVVLRFLGFGVFWLLLLMVAILTGVTWYVFVLWFVFCNDYWCWACSQKLGGHCVSLEKCLFKTFASSRLFPWVVCFPCCCEF